MRNYLKISLLIMVLALSGCGSGATSGDPLGTDTIAVAASAISLGAGESSIITATVLHADGRAATGRSVSFSIAPNNSGGTITVNNDGNNNGIATATYTAGPNTATISAQDTVIARIENGASAAVVITRAGSTTPIANAILTLGTSLATLSAGQNSTLTANVTDSAGAPLSGETVTFSLPVKNSGTPTLSAATAITDSSGNAITIYLPGTGAPTTSVDDVVQASLANGSTKLVTITRLGTAAAVTDNVISTLTASVTPLSVGQNSIITATVTDTAGAPVSGETVKFSIPVKGSGLPTLIPAPIAPATTTDVKTDTNGVAIAIYTPGVGSPTASVEDAVQATLTNGTGLAFIITRSGNVSPATNYVTLSGIPGGGIMGVGAANASGVITATVTNVAGNPVSGVTVTFSIAVWSSSGVYPAANPAYPVGPTLSNLTAVTDGNGNAITVYTSGATAGMTDVIRAVITDGDAAIVVTD